MNPHEITTLAAIVSSVSYAIGKDSSDGSDVFATLLFVGGIISATVAVTLRFVDY